MKTSGKGQTPSSLHDAFMASSGHKKNILGDYNYVGIGTGSKDGYLYVTVVFMKKGSTAPATTTTTAAPDETPDTKATTATTAPKPDKAAAAATSTTTTTIPPTTTTTLIVGPDKAVTPGMSCVTADRFGHLCHD